MSLINDALRRTRDAARPTSPGPQPVAPDQPAAAPTQPASASASPQPVAPAKSERPPQAGPAEPPKPTVTPEELLLAMRPQKPAPSHRPRLILTVSLSLLALAGLFYATYQFSYVFPRARMDHYMPATSTPPPLNLPPNLDGTAPKIPPTAQPEPASVALPEPALPPPAVAVPVPPSPGPTAPAAAAAPAVPPPPAAGPVQAPAPTAPAELPKLVIQGFDTVGGIRKVMINGRTLRVGDSIHGAKILAIDKPVVRVLFDGREIELDF